jgi:hypothetical protein
MMLVLPYLIDPKSALKNHFLRRMETVRWAMHLHGDEAYSELTSGIGFA